MSLIKVMSRPIFIMEDEYLEHFGTKGMRWGHRKAKTTRSSESAKLRSIQKKKVSHMTNAELQEANARLNLEANYRQLSSRDVSSGKTWLKNVGMITAATVGASLAIRYGNKGASAVEKYAPMAADALVRKIQS